MSRSRFAPSTVVAVAAVVLSASTAAGAGPPAERPRGTARVEPWAASLPLDEWSGPDRRAVHPPKRLWPESVLERLRRAALVAPDLPPGRELEEVIVDPDSEAPSLAPLAPGRQTSFPGLIAGEAGFGGSTFYPPDTSIAASRTRVVEVVNTAIRLTDRQGVEMETVALNPFFADMGFLFDPKVVYDPRSRRFFIVALRFDDSPRRSFIYLGVSRSDSPQGLSAPEDFCTYRIRSKRGGSWADYPGIGLNERWLAVAVNNFRFSSSQFKASFVYATRIEELADNAASCPDVPVDRYKLRLDSDGAPAFTVQPALHTSASGLPGAPLFFVSAQFTLAGSRRYAVWRLDDADGSAGIRHTMVEGDGTYTLAPLAEQKNGLELDGGDPRVTQAAFHDGRLWAVHGTGCAIGGGVNEGCVRAVEITPSAADATITYEETFGRSGRWYYWPGLAINGNGDVVSAFQTSAGNRYLGVAYNGKRRAAAGFDAVRNLRRGRCSIENFDSALGAHRTGDYVGAAPDPDDDRAFWIAGEHAGRTEDGDCDWETRVARVRY